MRRKVGAAAFATAAIAIGGAGTASAEEKVVEVTLGSQAEVERLIATGADIDHNVDRRDGKVVVEVVTDELGVQELRSKGFAVGREVFSESTSEARLAERDRQLAADTPSEAEGVKILRSNWYTTQGGSASQGDLRLHVEAKSFFEEDDTLTVRWDRGAGTEMGSGGSATLTPFVELGVYLYHTRTLDLRHGVDERPARIELSSSRTGKTVTSAVEEWLPVDGSKRQDPYLTGFVDHYMDATEITARAEALAKEFPELAEIVALPYETNGYRRRAQAMFGGERLTRFASSPQDPSALYLTSRAWGHEGGNGISARLADPGTPGRSLDVSVGGKDIVVTLATDASGAFTSTAAEVVAAINGDAEAAALVKAATTRANAGNGVVKAQGPLVLSDMLDAPAHISREPFTVRALRIGRHRDGSRPGVLAYSQEHAREWQTPLVTMETAERLLRNYGHDGATKQLLNSLDIFIVPTVNPDGSHFSFYDRAGQRRNMVNHCDETLGDPIQSEWWGLDINRNYDFGSVFDGYFGATHPSDDRACVSDVFAGPHEGSDSESRNIMWLADQHENIRFAMNIHSSGNYCMWSPGAYKLAGRETLPRPTLGEETFFWAASQKILSRIKEHRGLSVPISRTGPIVDVLYSAAGNSGDRLWYVNDIYAWNFEVGTSFQPGWGEAYAEAQEFSNGLIGLMEVAYQFEKDHQPPTAALVGDASAFRFDVSEPSTVFYTLDGSDPATSGTRKLYANAGVRDTDGEALSAPAGTEVRWFAADAAGNRSNQRSTTLGG